MQPETSGSGSQKLSIRMSGVQDQDLKRTGSQDLRIRIRISVSESQEFRNRIILNQIAIIKR